jgi:hypothetical protein
MCLSFVSSRNILGIFKDVLPGVMAPSVVPVTWEVEAGESQVPSQSEQKQWGDTVSKENKKTKRVACV